MTIPNNYTAQLNYQSNSGRTSERLHLQLDQNRVRLRYAENKTANLSKELATVTTRLKETQRKLGQTRIDLSETRGHLVKARGQVQENESRLRATEKKLERTHSQAAKYKDEIVRLTSELKAASPAASHPKSSGDDDEVLLRWAKVIWHRFKKGKFYKNWTDKLEQYDGDLGGHRRQSVVDRRRSAGVFNDIMCIDAKVDIRGVSLL